MSMPETEWDESVPTFAADKPAWSPGPEVGHHSGQPLDPSFDFFAPPPAEIGDVLTAESTLKRGKRPMPFGSRLLLCGLCASIGVSALYFSGFAEPILEVLAAFTLAGLTWLFTGFRKKCSYVGKLGTARLSCSGNRSNLKKPDLFLFADARELRTSQTRNYTNGVYTGTTYSYVWKDVEGRTRYKLNGSYSGEKKAPKPSSPFHFATAAEVAWSGFLLDQAIEELNRNGCIRFNLGGSDWVAVGPGFMDFHIKGKDARCTIDEIAGITINGGVFEIRRTDAKVGWFSKTGVFQFQYGQMANARLFLMALNKLLGYQFS